MAEVVVGAKTSGFSSGLARMQNQWATFKRQVTKKFSLADLGKGLMQGMGIGSVQAAAEQIGAYFEHGAKMAEIFAEKTRNAYENTRTLLSLRMTPQQRINEAQHDIAFQKDLIAQQEGYVEKLQADPRRILPGWMQVIQEESQKLSGMKDKLGQSQTGLEASKIAERKRQEGLREQGASIDDQRAILRGQLTPEQAAKRAYDRSMGRLIKNAGAADAEERMLETARARLAMEEATMARQRPQFRGIKGDSLARIGGGGNVYAPAGGAGINPAQALVSESTKHTKLLSSIVSNTNPKSGAVAEFVFTK